MVVNELKNVILFPTVPANWIGGAQVKPCPFSVVDLFFDITVKESFVPNGIQSPRRLELGIIVTLSCKTLFHQALCFGGVGQFHGTAVVFVRGGIVYNPIPR